MENITCFKCGKWLHSSMTELSPWEGPSDGSLFEGGHTFGSTLYDSAVDGITVQIVACDDCLKAAKGTNALREIKIERQRSIIKVVG